MTTASATRTVLDAISRDSLVTDEPEQAAKALRILYDGNLDKLRSAIEGLLGDDDWSQDRTPYEWLDEVRRAL